jgi:hypothetical protein
VKAWHNKQLTWFVPPGRRRCSSVRGSEACLFWGIGRAGSDDRLWTGPTGSTKRCATKGTFYHSRRHGWIEEIKLWQVVVSRRGLLSWDGVGSVSQVGLSVSLIISGPEPFRHLGDIGTESITESAGFTQSLPSFRHILRLQGFASIIFDANSI